MASKETLIHLLTEKCRTLEELCSRYYDRLAVAENYIEANSGNLRPASDDKLSFLTSIGLERLLKQKLRLIEEQAKTLDAGPTRNNTTPSDPASR